MGPGRRRSVGGLVGGLVGGGLPRLGRHHWLLCGVCHWWAHGYRTLGGYVHAEVKHWLAKLFCWLNSQGHGLLAQITLKVCQGRCLSVDFLVDGDEASGWAVDGQGVFRWFLGGRFGIWRLQVSGSPETFCRTLQRTGCAGGRQFVASAWPRAGAHILLPGSSRKPARCGRRSTRRPRFTPPAGPVCDSPPGLPIPAAPGSQRYHHVGGNRWCSLRYFHSHWCYYYSDF